MKYLRVSGGHYEEIWEDHYILDDSVNLKEFIEEKEKAEQLANKHREENNEKVYTSLINHHRLDLATLWNKGEIPTPGYIPLNNHIYKITPELTETLNKLHNEPHPHWQDLIEQTSNGKIKPLTFNIELAEDYAPLI